MPRVGRALASPLRDLAGRLLYASGVTRAARAAGGLLTIATFHRVLAGDAAREYPLPQIGVTPDELEWFIAFFARHYTCGPLGPLHRRWLDGERPARPFLAITFDDGQRDNHDHARPVLERAGVAATFFVVADALDSGEALWHDRLAYAAGAALARDPEAALRLSTELGLVPDAASGPPTPAGFVRAAKRLPHPSRSELVARLERAAGGARRPGWDGFMSWDQLRSLAAAGHEIGSHSSSHPLLPSVDDRCLEHETTGSRRRIEAALGACCESFCYPNGDCDARVADAVRRAGYLRAVTTAWGPNAAGTDPFRLARCDIQGRHARDRTGALSEPRLALRLSRWFPGPRP
jgi:peptidoglycan/xylan/chitin deacetylase (PgdA/CDA1 family)